MQGTSGLSWVVDPLDGTVNFLFGIPQWCVSVAVRDGEGTVAGAVYDPNRDELFSATQGRSRDADDGPVERHESSRALRLGGESCGAALARRGPGDGDGRDRLRLRRATCAPRRRRCSRG